MKKFICYTLDLEPDFGGRTNSYSSLDDMSYFQDIIQKSGIKLTTFAAGNLFEKKREIIKRFIDMGSEIELHSYSHEIINQDEEYEIKKSKKAYMGYFGKKPLGYRAPKGIITKKGFKALASENFKFDSSIYPTVLFGRYNNLRYPTMPFYLKEYKIIEIPFSVIPIIRLPLAMGYLQPVGQTISKQLINILGLPNIIVFDFHMWNLYKPNNIGKLPLKWRVLLARNLDKGMDMFKAFIKVFDEKGYKSIYMRDLHYMAKKMIDKNELAVY